MRRRLTLVAGQGDMGGGEQMLLRIGEAAQCLDYEVLVVGPRWGDLHEACTRRGFTFVGRGGASRRSYGVSAAAYLGRRHLGLVWANGAMPALAATATPNTLAVHLHQRPSASQAKAIWSARLRARAVIVPSHSMGAAIPGSRVMLNWTEDLAQVPRHPEAGVFTIAYLGRLSIDKGLDTLAAAADRLAFEVGVTRVRLLLGGDSRFVPIDAAKQVRHALQGCSAEVVEMGWSEPQRVLAKADVVVVPSRWPESFGLVAAEAMAMGCPLIVSDAGALPEVVGAAYPWIFAAGSVDELTRMLYRVWSDGFNDTGELRLRWLENFSPTAGIERLGSMLSSIGSL